MATQPNSRFQFQIDKMETVPLTKEPEVKMQKKNDEPCYALVVVDILSKYANVAPMTNKDGKSVLSMMKER